MQNWMYSPTGLGAAGDGEQPDHLWSFQSSPTDQQDGIEMQGGARTCMSALRLLQESPQLCANGIARKQSGFQKGNTCRRSLLA